MIPVGEKLSRKPDVNAAGTTGGNTRKKLFGYDYTDSELVKLGLYLGIGGTAALVEWALFWTFTEKLGIYYLVSTALAFLLATVYHYFLGNILVFTSGVRYSKGKELSLVLFVSTVGLGLNLLLMYLFVSLQGLDPLLSKVLASILVVAWNYLSRKKWIFKEDV